MSSGFLLYGATGFVGSEIARGHRTAGIPSARQSLWG